MTVRDRSDIEEAINEESNKVSLKEGELLMLTELCSTTEAFLKVDDAIENLTQHVSSTIDSIKENDSINGAQERKAAVSLRIASRKLRGAFNKALDEFERSVTNVADASEAGEQFRKAFH